MLDRRQTLAAAAGLGISGAAASAMGSTDRSAGGAQPTHLAVLWSSGDPDVAHRVCLMYTHAAKQYGWFERVHLTVWGPSQRLLVGDKDLKSKIAAMRADGVVVEACIACAQSFGLTEALGELGLPVRGMGGPLTDFLKDPTFAVLTF